MFCYNCKVTANHSSVDCPLPPRFTRCSVCDTVAFSQTQHKSWCSNKNMSSQSLSSTNTVFESKLVAELGFRQVQNVFLVDGDEEKPVSTSLLFVSNAQAIVYKKESHLCFEFVKPDNQIGSHINLMNSENANVMHIESKSGVLIVNGRYRISNGVIEINAMNGGQARNMEKIMVKVENVGPEFLVNLYDGNFVYTFKASSNGATFVDCLQLETIDQTQNLRNSSNGNYRLSDIQKLSVEELEFQNIFPFAIF